MYTSSLLEFPQITHKFMYQCWCPRIFQNRDKKSYRFYESSISASQPMYVALNTKNYNCSLMKAHWQQNLIETEDSHSNLALERIKS